VQTVHFSKEKILEKKIFAKKKLKKLVVYVLSGIYFCVLRSI